MSVPEMREWLRNWVANATGQAPGSIDESVPMVEPACLARRRGDGQRRRGPHRVTLTATVAFRHPTIESLATVIIEGERETADDSPSTGGLTRRDVPEIAIVGIATRFPAT